MKGPCLGTSLEEIADKIVDEDRHCTRGGGLPESPHVERTFVDPRSAVSYLTRTRQLLGKRGRCIPGFYCVLLSLRDLSESSSREGGQRVLRTTMHLSVNVLGLRLSKYLWIPFHE